MKIKIKAAKTGYKEKSQRTIKSHFICGGYFSYIVFRLVVP
jgi:hypothetical protein